MSVQKWIGQKWIGVAGVICIALSAAAQTNLLSTSGPVGIGTTSPKANLQVVGQSWFGQYMNGTAVIDAFNGDAFFGDNTATNGIAVSANGSVGIGTTAPGAMLDIANVNPTTLLRLTSGAPVGIYYLAGRSYIPQSGIVSYAFDLQNNGTTYPNALTFSGYNGYVGIGTTSPTVGLTVGSTTSTGAWYGNSGILVQGSNPGISFANSASSIQRWAIANGEISANDGILTIYDANNHAHPLTIIPVSDYVGIGTATPGAQLEVNGAIKLTRNSGGAITFADGTTQSTAYNGVVCGGDYAESVDVTGDRKHYQPGDVLVIDPDAPGKFLKSAEPYSTSVAGIYSTKPGYVGRRQTTPKSPDEVPMAMVGIVPTKVSAENGAIHPGDILVTSSKLGYAMKGTDRTRLIGAVVGKALGKLDSGTGTIEVLVSLQ